jgi:hypothetical protein
MNSWLINPLRLGSATELKAEDAGAEVSYTLPMGRQLALYGTLVFGNVASNFLDAYRSGMPWRPNILALVFAFIVGIVLLPGAIDTNKLNGQREELVQFATVFTYGMGWQTLLGAAIQAAATGRV